MNTKQALLAAAFGLTIVSSVDVARAETPASQTGGRRTNDLAEQVAVRHRRLLVKNRFEFTPPAFNSSTSSV